MAGGDVVLPAVPGAGDDAAGDGSFGEWAALMRTQAVEGVEVTIEIKQRDDSASDGKLSAGAGRDVSDGREFVPVGHAGYGRGCVAGTQAFSARLVRSDVWLAAMKRQRGRGFGE